MKMHFSDSERQIRENFIRRKSDHEWKIPRFSVCPSKNILIFWRMLLLSVENENKHCSKPWDIRHSYEGQILGRIKNPELHLEQDQRIFSSSLSHVQKLPVIFDTKSSPFISFHSSHAQWIFLYSLKVDKGKSNSTSPTSPMKNTHDNSSESTITYHSCSKLSLKTCAYKSDMMQYNVIWRFSYESNSCVSILLFDRVKAICLDVKVNMSENVAEQLDKLSVKDDKKVINFSQKELANSRKLVENAGKICFNRNWSENMCTC